MFSHISLGTNDFDRAVVFYDAVLSALGYKQVMRFEQAAAWGDQFPEFWVGPPLDDSKPAAPGNGTHVAFTAKSRAEVDAFHQAALAAGATDAGAPGPRPQYGPLYYGSFALDPDGHKIEAMCMAEE